jgi:hypothetical protein
MHALHDIRIPGLDALVWMFAYGGNSRVIGDTRRETSWGNPLLHSYAVERGDPPPIPEMNEQGNPVNRVVWNARYYWGPWQTYRGWTREQMITPICGQLRTASRQPRIDYGRNDRTWRTPRLCPDCHHLEPGTRYFQELSAEDPWNQRRVANGTQANLLPDPLTGM